MSDDRFIRDLHDAGAGPRTMAAIRRAFALLRPSFDEPEVAAAKKTRAANRMLRDCLAKRPKRDKA